jgi:polyhydroxybutyrate depolymerase
VDSIFHDDRYRSYIAHIHPEYDASNQYELVFVLHGGTGNSTFMILNTSFNAVNDTANFIAVYPQRIYTGPNIGGDGHHWVDGRLTTIPDSLGIDDVGFISSLIDKLSIEYSINLTRVYATGISNGGYMAQRLACELSEKITAVATVAATFPDSLKQYCLNPDPVSILVMNGTNDFFVPTYTAGMVAELVDTYYLPTA